VDWISAILAQQSGLILVGGLVPFEFIFCAVTTFTDRERFSFFDPHDRNEKNV
jgi:hypothetical protein